MRKLILILALLCVSLPVAAAEIQVGEMAHDYAGLNSSNEKILLSEHRGKVIVLTFWATWCAPCLEELPILESIQGQVSPERLLVIAINYKQGKKAFRKIKRLLNDFQLTLSYDKRDKVSRRYRVKGIPYTLIIDKTGRVAHIHSGYGDGVQEILVRELNALLMAE